MKVIKLQTQAVSSWLKISAWKQGSTGHLGAMRTYGIGMTVCPAGDRMILKSVPGDGSCY